MRQSEITEWTGKLIKSLGRPRPRVEPEALRKLHAGDMYFEMLKLIKRQMHLDMRMQAAIVNSGKPEGVGLATPAWVTGPAPMPPFGTREFRETLVVVHMRKQFLAAASFEGTVAMMAHEFSHVVLNSLGHELRTIEKAVDLTAMLLGYRQYYLAPAVKASTTKDPFAQMLGMPEELLNMLDATTINGYLSLEEREYANWIMERWP